MLLENNVSQTDPSASIVLHLDTGGCRDSSVLNIKSRLGTQGFVHKAKFKIYLTKVERKVHSFCVKKGQKKLIFGLFPVVVEQNDWETENTAFGH